MTRATFADSSQLFLLRLILQNIGCLKTQILYQTRSATTQDPQKTFLHTYRLALIIPAL